MSVYGASFVRADRATTFADACRMLREHPTTRDHTVRTSPGDWVSIENAIADPLLETLSRELGTTAITIYAIDEKLLRFHYRRFEHGRSMRSLDYADAAADAERGSWTGVEGEPEPWETLLFSPRMTSLYRKYAADEVCTAPIRLGASIPWCCDGFMIGEIARALDLPWDPVHDRFPPAAHTAIIEGHD